MSIKACKALLNNYKYQKLEIQEKETRLDDLKNLVISSYKRLNEIKELTKRKDIDKQFEEMMQHWVEEEKNFFEDLKKRYKIEKVIDALKQPSRAILYARYVANSSFENIAERMNYSSKRLYQLHIKAMEEFEEKLNSDEFTDDTDLE